MLLLRFFRRLAKALLYMILLIAIIPVAGLAYGFLSTDALDTTPLTGPADVGPPSELAAKVRAETPGYQRPQQATFLLYPEFSIAYAARDYADFVKVNAPSGFPYWSYIARYWQDYATIARASSTYPLDLKKHAMLVAIGTAYSLEEIIEWAYENTIGRITLASANGRTAVDAYQASVAAEYAAFLERAPWYEFPYAEKRAGLMALQRAPGDDELRTTERRWAFGLAYWIEQACASLVSPGEAATSDPAPPDIYVWVKGPIGEAVRGEEDALLERDLGDDGSIVVTKPGRDLTDLIPRLIDKGVSFVEIGGNDEIMMTVLSPGTMTAPKGSRTLFEYALPADPGERRTGLVVAVGKLDMVVPALLGGGARLERVYDY
jgi:hypothetical protein